MLSILAALAIAKADPVTLESKSVQVGSKIIHADIVRVHLDQVRIKIGLAQDKVGPTESLASLSNRSHTWAAINGSFFDAYIDRPIKSPHHTVITGGKVVHIGNVGSLIGFKPSGQVVIGRLDLSILGRRDGSDRWPYKWYAYWINRYPTAGTVTIFTPQWGTSTGIEGGKQIVVDNGLVQAIEDGSVRIPETGWVLYIRGVTDTAFDKIALRSRLDYRVVNKQIPSGDWGPFEGVVEAVGAGPTLVKEGKISLDPEGEGFSSPKILSGAGARSAVGLTSNNELLMVVSSGTIRDLAGLMLALGCHDAMNLDGGASSGLIFKGKAIRTPGRLISNAILVLSKS